MAIITSLLDNDWYSFTMGAAIARHYPWREVAYQFTNRNTGFRSADYVDLDELRAEIEAFRALHFSLAELDYLRNLGPFGRAEIDRLSRLVLPEVNVEARNGQLSVRAQGLWSDGVYLEVPILAIITELTTRRLLQERGWTAADAERESLRRLQPKIDLLKANPGIRFSPFGARRRASRRNEQLVIAELMEKVPDQIVGISNVQDAMIYGKPVSGTIAHQWQMVLAAYHIGIGTPRPLVAALQESLDVWEADYADIWNGGLLTLIPDTFGTDFFLRHLTAERAERWKTTKQDSGDPNAFNAKVLARLAELDVSLADKRIIHTDGLNVPKMIQLYERWNSQIQVGFGPGTNLTNDVGVATHSFIWKPTWVKVNGHWIACAKLTDNLSKAIGDPGMVRRLKREAGYSNTFSELQTV